MYCLLLQITDDILFRRLDLNRKELLLLPAVQRQDTVPCQTVHRFFKVIIHLIHRFRFLVLRRRDNTSLLRRDLPDPDPVIRLIGNTFGNDVFRPCNRLFYSIDALLRIYVLCRDLLDRLLRLLQRYDCRQRF